MNKKLIAERYGTIEKFVLPAGRKSRQKARKLSELNPDRRVVVITKKGKIQFEAYYGQGIIYYNNWYHVFAGRYRNSFQHRNPDGTYFLPRNKSHKFHCPSKFKRFAKARGLNT